MNIKIDIGDSKQLSKKQKYITVSGELEGAPKLTVLNLALRNRNDKVSWLHAERFNVVIKHKFTVAFALSVFVFVFG